MAPVTLPSVAEAPTLDIWPTAGRAIGCNSKAAAHRAARAGGLPTVQISERRWRVPNAALRQLLGLPIDGPALTIGGDEVTAA